MRCPRCARRWTIAATTPPRRAASLAPLPMPGPTGESNELHYRGRGVFVCISPWNFPLAIFLGQVTAALAAGNAVVAKPAEQTPLIAAEAVRLLHQAGVPVERAASRAGRRQGRRGADRRSARRGRGLHRLDRGRPRRSTARSPAKDGPIVPLIAETGGINAMIVDATALPEQVADDVMTSAFRSAGQRCSALRLLCVQEDVADRMLEMIAGAAKELALGDPRDPATQVGPVIDSEAKERLDRWLADDGGAGPRDASAGTTAAPLPPRGLFVPPSMIALDRAARLQGRGVRPDPACRALARRPARCDCSTTSPATAPGSRSASTPASTRRRTRSSRGLRTAMSTSTAA